ncbi:MAG: sensor histidine kinase [Dissulfurispiraceae bacterium]
MLSEVITASKYSLNLHALPLLVVAIGIIITAARVHFDEGINRISTTFLLLDISLCLWLLSRVGLYSANDAAVALWWAKAGYFGIAFIPSTLYLISFAVLKSDEKKRFIVWSIWLFSLFSCLIIVRTDFIIEGVRRFFWGYYPQYTAWGGVYLIIYCILLGLPLYDLIREYPLSPPGSTQRLRNKSFLIAFGVGSAALVDFVACFNIPVYPFGYIGIFIALLIMLGTISKYRLVDITPRFAAEGVINSMNDALLVLDSEGIVRLINHSSVILFGLPETDLLGKHIKDIISDNDLPDFSVLVRRHTLPNQEFSYVHPKNGNLALSMSVSTMSNIQGQLLAIVCIARDITDRKLAEQQIKQSLKEKEALLREIHHRVKNNLAIVSSLLSLEARKIKDAGVKSLFEESQQRVRSMALVHEKLYQTKDLSSINFESYIKSMVLDIISMYRIDTSAITTEINIRDIELDLESAVPCGLIINELLTNAFKHAFPKKGKGVLSINFTKTDGTYTLAIKDNGIGLPEGFDYKEAGTLGLQLVNILTDQLGGTLEIKSDKGTEAVVMFKTERE